MRTSFYDGMSVEQADEHDAALNDHLASALVDEMRGRNRHEDDGADLDILATAKRMMVGKPDVHTTHDEWRCQCYHDAYGAYIDGMSVTRTLAQRYHAMRMVTVAFTDCIVDARSMHEGACV